MDVVVAQRHEVDVPGVVRPDDPPGAERAAELERRAARRARDPRAWRFGSPGIARSTSSVSRPSSRSRTAPPTSQTPPRRPAPRCATRERFTAHTRAGRAGTEAARDLVVDRAERARPVLGQDPLAAAGAEQHGLGAALDRLVAEVDGDVVHRDGARERDAAAADQHLGAAGEAAADAVAVADRDRRDPRVALGDEAAPVAGALPRPRALDLGDVADELERRLEPVLGRVAVERVHAVDRDPAADHVQPRRRLAQRRGGVRGVAHDAERVGPGQEALELLGHELRVVVGGREVGHRAREPRARRRGATRVASSGSRVPSRPMPVSSLTCTRASRRQRARRTPRARRRCPRRAASAIAQLLGATARPSRAAAPRCRRRAARPPRPRSPPPATTRRRAGPRAPPRPRRGRSRSALTTAHSGASAASRAQLRSIAPVSTRASARRTTPRSARRARRSGSRRRSGGRARRPAAGCACGARSPARPRRRVASGEIVTGSSVITSLRDRRRAPCAAAPRTSSSTRGTRCRRRARCSAADAGPPPRPP